MSRRTELLRLLAGGDGHSREALAATLGVPRSEVNDELRELASWGLEFEAAAGGGQRLLTPVDLIDVDTVRADLAPGSRATLERLERFDAVDSTNARLLEARGLKAGAWRACLAEYQTAGRGRRGRIWTAPFASGLCLSFGWTFASPPAALPAMSLAVGVAVIRALTAVGVAGLSLKWPNDVLKDDRKLGGVLCEMRADADGAVYVVVGLGLNVRLPAGARAAIIASGGVDPTDLASAAVSRTRLVTVLLDALVVVATEFAAHGFTPFAAEWNRADALRDRAVRVSEAAAERDGIARGIDPDGALRVEMAGQLRRLTAGDVTLRAVA
jgi:BirA family biotin operon repressor/biotin-[acetyl-CoA-carboxylase] ligase